MLNKAKTLRGYTLHGLDGKIGKAKEFYFDDHYWTVRYLVADTGNYLLGRQVLISPYALVGVDQKDEYITISLTKKQIEDSPALNTDQPVSQQFEEAYFQYYRWPQYWDGPYDWGQFAAIERDPEKRLTCNQGGKAWDSHLRSTHDVSGYHIQATDGDIGHVDDFIIDDATWTIRYLVIDTNNWWPGKKVLIAPQWIERVSWNESTVFVGLPREIIRESPEFTDASELTRDYEIGLHRLYDRQGYWVDEDGTKNKLP
ncbi:PRC-barrel domain-containing protein [Methylovulum psychrotolerans]|uniref:Photosystem reaction center subunit H n=1 Tax=Methylovulum psychrotolerans TaxID=1704499 RepID=A0A1Z4BZE7_9GAMM|nr:PRC-barrel domain-containing protein [Methylovulum psychrotolerans]ASF46631.1 photosystem reaction center subunit H [Methylovulum psychrotolerans]MBT9100320.1 PRC-barrel domain-containing protein [Methylovulum psychrotolerans]